ncbi:Fucose 4-O-acetylase [Streptosporangium subroseum]|uniref:Fucose 4-O-acetylase n=1 Tax=Streptosporangium subroseum TaxID=106412 RepID=A0A239NYR9_9ACTN|nr:acyltransferase family protein [Streptosporangium subroseum]SNT59900.1 Fucose 4-O-acetylase [Streptosporangium subroseum]
MSDIRPSFPTPAPQDDGVPDADTGRPTGGQGRTPAPQPTPERSWRPPASQPSWPEPPAQPYASGRQERGHAPEEEDPGEVTAWGYPAYQEPPDAPDGSREPRQDQAHEPQRGRPYGSPDPLRASAPLEPLAWREPPESRDSQGTHETAWAPESTGPNRRESPWREEGAPEGAPPSPRVSPEAPPSRRPLPQPREALLPPLEAPPAPADRPFSYWESSGRQSAEPSFWSRSSDPEREAMREWRAEREREQAEEPPAPPVKKKRDPYLDNVKFVLIALVATGHSLVPTLSAHSAKSAYIFIYMFHMPAFVLVSGYLGRNFWNSNAKINKLVDTLLIPYAVVEIGYALLRYGLGQKWTLTIIDPAWLNWYLLALVLWRISTPIWTRMRQPLLIAVIIYMMAGFSEIGGDFSIDRFFGLLPFYVLGLLLRPEHFDLLKPIWVRILGGVVLVGAAGVAIFIAPHVKLAPVYYRYSFKGMDMSWWMGLGVRGAMLVAGMIMTFAVLAVIPRRETWFSDLGTRTLYAYLLHGVIVLIAKDQHWLSFPWLHGPLGVMAIASSALALVIVLCLPETRTLFKWLLEPRLVWLYRRPSASAEAVPKPPDEPAARESSASVTR